MRGLLATELAGYILCVSPLHGGVGTASKVIRNLHSRLLTHLFLCKLAAVASYPCVAVQDGMMTDSAASACYPLSPAPVPRMRVPTDWVSKAPLLEEVMASLPLAGLAEQQVVKAEQP